MEEKEYWTKRHAEEVAKLQKAVGTAKRKRIMAELEAEATAYGWTQPQLVNKIIETREKAFMEALQK